MQHLAWSSAGVDIDADPDDPAGPAICGYEWAGLYDSNPSVMLADFDSFGSPICPDCRRIYREALERKQPDTE